MTFRFRRPPRANIKVIAMTCIAVVLLPAAVANPIEFATEVESTSVNTPQRLGLTQEIAQFRSRIALAQVALNQGQQDISAQGTLSESRPTGGTVGIAMGLTGVPNSPLKDTKAMPMAAGCCAGVMGQMGAAGPAPTSMQSSLPGFPGASHLYHVGATGFFLEYSAAIKLTMNQQAALNAIKETSIGNQASAQRQIDQAEQELWILTSSDQPDLLAIETKLHAIENLKSAQRIAFIRSVGEAARMLSKEQRSILLGTIAPVTAPMPGATNDSMGNMNSGDTPKPKSDDGMGDM